MDSALVRYKEAYKYYSKIESSEKNRLSAYQQIGRTYEDMANLDSALVYFEKGSVLAKQIKDYEYETTFTFLTGVVLLEKGDYTQSEEYLYKALKETKNEREKLKIHLSLARLYIKLNKPDGAQSHINEIKSGLSKINDNIGLRSIYTSLADFYTLNSDYKEALYYEKLIGEINLQISEESGLEKLIVAEKKHQLYIKDKEYAEARQKLIIISGIIFGVAFFLVFIAALLLRNKRLKFEKEQEKNKLLDAENKLLHAENELLSSGNQLLKQRAANLSFLQSICRHIIHDWADIDRDMKQYTLEHGDAETEPEVYKRIKRTIDSIKLKAKDSLIEHAKTNLLNLGVQNITISSLTDRHLLIYILDKYRYRKADILEIIALDDDGAIDEDGLNHEMLIISTILKRYGIIKKSTNPLIFRRK
jgi:hypothetical protein